MSDEITCDSGWHDKSPVDLMSLLCVIIVIIIIGPNNSRFPWNILTPCYNRCHGDPSCWFAIGWGELHITKFVVEFGFASKVISCICWVINAPYRHYVTCGGIGTWLGGRVACMVGNDYVCTLSIVVTFVMTRSQLLEGLKCESQTENNGRIRSWGTLPGS
jgi:hypothetical protein